MIFKDLGLIPYEQALLLQEELVEQRASEKIKDTILFCSHPPVVTLGRSTKASDVSGWSGQTFEVRRGGRATYHGPNQLVIYPIIHLSQKFKKLKEKDVMSYLTFFELAVMKTLKQCGYDDVYLKEDVDYDEEGKKLLNRGLWIKEKKIAAFGIAVRKWVTYHGCAINIERDKEAFQGINPCGFQTSAIGALEEFKALDREVLKQSLQKNIPEFLC